MNKEERVFIARGLADFVACYKGGKGLEALAESGRMLAALCEVSAEPELSREGAVMRGIANELLGANWTLYQRVAETADEEERVKAVFGERFFENEDKKLVIEKLQTEKRKMSDMILNVEKLVDSAMRVSEYVSGKMTA